MLVPRFKLHACVTACDWLAAQLAPARHASVWLPHKLAVSQIKIPCHDRDPTIQSLLILHDGEQSRIHDNDSSGRASGSTHPTTRRSEPNPSMRLESNLFM